MTEKSPFPLGERANVSSTIWKYDIGLKVPGDPFTITMPTGAKTLSVQAMRKPAGGSQLWCWIPDTAAPRQARRFVIYGTGWPLPEHPGEYVGTFQTPGDGIISDTFVWHLFALPIEGVTP